MPIDAQEPLSPGWWFKKLLRQLGDRQNRLDRLDRYYRGDCDMPWGPANSRDAFLAFQRKARANWSGLIVETTRERMKVTGFRTGAEGDEGGDDAAWQIWQANQLDAGQVLVHRSQLSMGDAYVIVGGPDSEIGAPLITPEDPRQVVTAHDPVKPRKVIAALKVFTDDLVAADVAYLYLPGRVFRASKRRSSTTSTLGYDVNGWEWDGQATLPAAVVPVVRFANRANLAGQSMGEFEDVLDHIDRINSMILQRMTIAYLQAFRQRAIKGAPTHDAEGNEVDYDDIFAAAPGALWQLPPETEMWESGQVDLTPILESVKADVRDLAGSTKTPMFLLFPDTANGSAEGAALQREGLIFKVHDRITETSECWERVMALAFLFAGDLQRASLPDMEALWAPPERFSLAERYDAAVKASAAGVPWRTVMEDVLQFSPQQVNRMEADRVTDALLNPEPAVVPAVA